MKVNGKSYEPERVKAYFSFFFSRSNRQPARTSPAPTMYRHNGST